MILTETSNKKNLSYDQFRKEALRDYRLALLSRHCSLNGRKEVLTGKAKFGIFGDVKQHWHMFCPAPAYAFLEYSA